MTYIVFNSAADAYAKLQDVEVQGGRGYVLSIGQGQYELRFWL